MNITEREEYTRIKTEDLPRDFGWVRAQQEAGKLLVGGTALTDEGFLRFRSAIKLITDIYDNNWDFDLNVIENREGSFSYQILSFVIHFAEVTMRNSREQTHNIKDLFIKTHLYSTNGGNSIEIGSVPEGGRTTYTLAEMRTGFMHSHLSSGTPTRTTTAPYYKTFCTGSGHINDTIAELRGDGFAEETFTSYLVQLMNLASWESLEGSPYISFRDVHTERRRARRNYILPNSTRRDFYSFLMVPHEIAQVAPAIDFDYSAATGYKVIDNERFMSFLMPEHMTEEDRTKYLCIAHQGRYYEIRDGESSSTRTPSFTSRPYIFAGQEFPFVVEQETVEQGTEEQEVNYTVFPRLKEHIINKINNETNKRIIRKSTIDRYQTETSDIPESIESDSTSV